MPNCFNINIMYHRTQKAEISQTIAQKLATTFMAFITIPTLTALPTYFMSITKFKSYRRKYVKNIRDIFFG